MTDSNKLSRRGFIGGAAIAGTSATLAACGGDDTPAGPNPDITVLNSLLSAEWLAIKAYAAGLPTLQMPATGDPLAANGPVLYVIAQRWQTQHQAHAAALQAAIRAIGGTPVDENSVTFTPPTGFSATVRNVMVLACNAEKAAAIAYNRAVKGLTAAGNRFLAGNIEGDESQHFIVLYALLQQVVAANPSGIITGTMDVVPQTFVVNYNGMQNGLEAVPDFTYTTA
ncbi:MAG: ferritin-like domain-containing protein [Polyangiales bacterium]